MTKVDLPFRMTIKHMYSMIGRGEVVVGPIEHGTIKVGDDVEVVGFKNRFRISCARIEVSSQEVNESRAGEFAAVFLRGIDRKDLKIGQIVAKPGSYP